MGEGEPGKANQTVDHNRMIHLVHGFNVADGGKQTVARLRPSLPEPVVVHDYGWTFVFRLRCRNAATVRKIGEAIEPGTVLVGHSNGALICYKVAKRYPEKVRAVVTINAAMRRDTIWPEGVHVLNLYNPHDIAVQAGRWWSRLVSLGGLHPHGWGAAGRYGFTEKQILVSNLNTAEERWSVPARRHSGVFEEDAAAFWGRVIAMWLAALNLAFRDR